MRRRVVAVGPGALGIAVLGGVWCAHALEYLRVDGPQGFSRAMARSGHTYMGPLGLVLLAMATATTVTTVVVAKRLEARLSELQRGVIAPSSEQRRRRAPIALLEVPALAAALWLGQMSLYVVQENLEAQARGLATPVLGPITGRHALAPVVQLAVALAITGVLYLTRRRVTELARAIARFLRDAHPRRVPILPAVRVVRSATPLERWGSQCWSRPPPTPRFDLALIAS